MHHVRERRTRGPESHRRYGWRVFNGTRKCMSEQRRVSSVLLSGEFEEALCLLMRAAITSYDDSVDFSGVKNRLSVVVPSA